jgi:hypothetical protein
MTVPFSFPLDHLPDCAEDFPPYLTDQADAFAAVLERFARRARAGHGVEDLAHELLPIVRIAARRT